MARSWLSRLIYGNKPGPTTAEQRSSQAIDRGPFDPGDAFQEYSKGAYSDFQSRLSRELERLGGASVGAGRFDSGLYDQDQGEIITELGRGYTSDLARQSLNVAGLRQRGDESYNELLAGQLDREEAKRNARRRYKSDLIRSGAKIGGTIAGLL